MELRGGGDADLAAAGLTGFGSVGAGNGRAILWLGVAAGLTAAVSLVSINHVKDVVVGAVLHGQPAGAALALHSLRLVDLALMAAAGLAVLALVWVEWRGRGFTRLLRTATDGEAFVVLTVLVAWFGHAYLSPGVLLGGDTATHISRFLEVARGLEQGELPQWTNYQYAGAPLLWFTGPLTYVLGGVVAFAVGDAVVAAKALMFGLHLAGGWLAFALLRRLGIGTVAAMVAAAGFAGSFAHLHLFLYRGVMPQALTIVLLLALFWAADGLLRGLGARWANVLVFALAWGAAIVNHQPHALFAAVYLALFGAVAMLTGFWRWRGVPLMVLAGVLGTVMAALAVAPLLFEADWVMIDPGDALFALQWPTAERLGHLVLWRNTRTTWAFDYWAYLGFGLLLFGAMGVVALVRRRIAGGVGIAVAASLVCLGLELFLYNPVVRDTMFMLLFLSIVAGAGLDCAMRQRMLAGRGLVLVVAVVLVDLASTSVQPVARTDKEFLVEAGRYLERVAPNERVVQLDVGADGVVNVDVGPDGSPISYRATVQRTAGNHNMAATRLHNVLMAVEKRAEAELRAGGVLSAETRTLLGLFNVTRLICNSSVANGCPAGVRDTREEGVLGRVLAVAARPALFSRRLVQVPLPPGVEKPMVWGWTWDLPSMRATEAGLEAAVGRLLAAEGVDMGAGTARAFAVRDAVPEGGAETGAWQAAVRSYRVGLDEVRLEVETDGPGYVQLAHPWFPSTVVTVNGAVALPLQGTLDLMVVPVGAGRSTVVLREGWTRVRAVSAGVSLVGLLAIVATAGWLGWRDRRVA